VDFSGSNAYNPLTMARSFIKMHGLGNDFVVLDARRSPCDPSEAQTRALANRKTGVGFDQLVLIEPPRTPGTAAFMRLRNADGGEVQACGNATRCVAALLMAETGLKQLTLESVVGPLHAWAAGELVTVDMGPARLEWQQIPLAEPIDTAHLGISEGPLADPVAVNMGNPHAVFLVADAEAVALAELGPRLEHHPLFPERTNVEVAQVLAPDRIRMRVWERGVGITRACGTGACATVVAAARRGVAERRAEVILDGGSLTIDWRATDDHVLMTGPAAISFTGQLSDALGGW